MFLVLKVEKFLHSLSNKMKLKKLHIIQIILIAILIKVIYVVFAFVVDSMSQDFGFGHDAEGIVSLFKRNDSYWYEDICTRGYNEITDARDLGWSNEESFHQSNWGFMPGYPILIKGLCSFGLSFNTSGFILAFCFSLLAFVLFYWLASIWFNDNKNGFFATLLFMCFPFHYYFSVLYTEPIYCALLIGMLLAVIKKRWVIVACLASYLVILRASGIVLILPLAIFILENQGVLSKLKLRKSLLSKDAIIGLVPLIFPALAFVGYCYFQSVNTGDPFAYSTAQQQGWNREFMFPLAGLFRSGSFVGQFNSFYAIVFMVIAFSGMKRLTLGYNLILWFPLLLPLAAGNVEGLPRYISTIFPFMFLFGYWLKNVKWKMLVLPILFGIQLYTFYFWLISHPFSR